MLAVDPTGSYKSIVTSERASRPMYWWIVGALFIAHAVFSTATAEERVALVVGVSTYGNDHRTQEKEGFVVPSPLPNATRDAHLIGDALVAAGFQVERLDNPSKRELLFAVSRFSKRLNSAGGDSLGVFYFAGHGTQGRPPFERDVDNFLLPIGTNLQTETDLEAEAVGLSRVSAEISSAQAGATIIVLDACRDFALPQSNRSGFRNRGLAEARAMPGTLIAYSTAPGGVANDGPPNGNGPYAAALARQLQSARNVRLEDIFYAVREEVLAATKGSQQPWENSSLVRPVMIGVSTQPFVASGVMYGFGRDEIKRIDDWNQCDDARANVESYTGSSLVSYAHLRMSTLCETGRLKSLNVDVAQPPQRAIADIISVEESEYPERTPVPFPMHEFERALRRELSDARTSLTDVRFGVAFVEPKESRSLAVGGTITGYLLVDVPTIPGCHRTFGGQTYRLPTAETGILRAINEEAPEIAAWIKLATIGESLTCPQE